MIEPAIQEAINDLRELNKLYGVKDLDAALTRLEKSHELALLGVPVGLIKEKGINYEGILVVSDILKVLKVRDDENYFPYLNLGSDYVGRWVVNLYLPCGQYIFKNSFDMSDAGYRRGGELLEKFIAEIGEPLPKVRSSSCDNYYDVATFDFNRYMELERELYHIAREEIDEIDRKEKIKELETELSMLKGEESNDE